MTPLVPPAPEGYLPRPASGQTRGDWRGLPGREGGQGHLGWSLAEGLRLRCFHSGGVGGSNTPTGKKSRLTLAIFCYTQLTHSFICCLGEKKNTTTSAGYSLLHAHRLYTLTDAVTNRTNFSKGDRDHGDLEKHTHTPSASCLIGEGQARNPGSGWRPSWVSLCWGVLLLSRH